MHSQFREVLATCVYRGSFDAHPWIRIFHDEMIRPSNRIQRMSSEPALDRTDFEILAALQKNARTSNKELALAIGLAESSCLERVRRLQRRGVLLGSHAEVDPRALGLGLQALIRVRLARHARKEVEAFQKHALALPEVLAIYHVTGEDDFLVHVATRDAEHLRGLTLEAFTTRKEVSRIQTSLIFAHARKPALPIPEYGLAFPKTSGSSGGQGGFRS